jgi:hypothetical protein
MGAPLLHVSAQAMCPHGGQVSIVSSNVRVKVGGQPVATLQDQFMIAGCAFTIPPSKPQPCMKVQWMQPALRVKVGGQPVILQSSTGLCQSADQIPAGPPNVVQSQMRVTGT